MLECVQNINRLDISVTTQQYTLYCNDPKASHNEAVKHICRYLLKLKTWNSF